MITVNKVLDVLETVLSTLWVTRFSELQIYELQCHKN